MFKAEYRECERLMWKAIRKAKMARDGFNKSDNYLLNDELRNIEQRRADQYYGEAYGIHCVLCALEFDHNGMEKLLELL